MRTTNLIKSTLATALIPLSVPRYVTELLQIGGRA